MMNINRIDNVFSKADDFLEEFDFEDLYSKLENINYIIPIPHDWENRYGDAWLDDCDESMITWEVPSIDILKHIFHDWVSNTYITRYGSGFDIFNFDYIDEEDIVVFNPELLNEEINYFNTLVEDYKYDLSEVLPTKPYVGNCSKEFCEIIVDMYWEREYGRIRCIEFPPTSFLIYTEKMCVNEIKNLINNPGTLYAKNTSAIIKHFHKSMYKASVGKGLSPYDGWQKIKNDPEIFKDFYRNRLRCSDWFKEKNRWKCLLRGQVMNETYGIGLSTSRKFQVVTYFKPKLAKYIVEKYLNDKNTVFDPFSGYSGRMLGVLSCNKNYIGQDLCESSVKESEQIYNFIKPYVSGSCDLSIKDSIKSFGKYECLLTCPPYGNIENWPGVKSINKTCDEWIDVCLSNYDCDRYVFVVDNNIVKYKDYIKEEIKNTSHFAPNSEYIVVIDREDLKNIKFDIDGEDIICEFKHDYTKQGIYLYNIFNQQVFNQYIDYPIEFANWVNIIYKKFNQPSPTIRDIKLPMISLNENNKVLLAVSGGLDSTYQILELQGLGYNVTLYHCDNINYYEDGQATKNIKALADKLNIKLVCPKIKKNFNSNYTKYWPENPIKNQFMLMNMIDYCVDNNIYNICMDGSWEFPIEETTAGVDVADAPENYKLFLEAISKFCNIKFIYTDHEISKFDKIKKLDSEGLMDYVYSCLGSGRFNHSRHDQTENKYNIKLFKNNCGCYCRKCAHHNLLCYYSGYKDFPPEFIDKCWNIMCNNSFSSRKMLFDINIPLEQRIKNLFVE